MTDAGHHQPVLLQEVLDGLSILAGGIYFDATFGRGGHSAALLARLGPGGRLFAFDQDPEAVAHAARTLAADPRFEIHRANFAELGDWAHQAGLRGRINGLLFDLGVSSPQLDDARRGFGFMQDGPLDMRMNPDAGESAAHWLARATETEIADVLWRYGEERQARRIARAIVNDRRAEPFTRTRPLAELIARVCRNRSGTDRHPATRSFQAIRIHINQELAALESALSAVPGLLAPAGRLAVISFHSLEDRIVKRFIRECERGPRRPRGLPQPTGWRASLRAVGSAVRAGEADRADNPRSRSAVLRIAERLP